MSRGLGRAQRAVLAAVEANGDGLTAADIVRHLHGDAATRAQDESVRRAIRTLHRRGLVSIRRRRVPGLRRSLKRVFDLSGCQPGFCEACGRRTRRVRLEDWHRHFMEDNASHDREWLDELTAAQASGFVHYAASDERLVAVEPDAIDTLRVWRQFVYSRGH